MNKFSDKEIKDIALSLNIDSLPIENQKEIAIRLENIILNRAVGEVEKSLSEEEKKKIENEEDTGFLDNKVVFFKEMIEKVSKEVVEEFRQKVKNKV
ncbi:MAG: hypothetical protein WCP15_02625 [bacterium]